ncbi:MAG: HNH endonuclease [Desulfobacteraceae bacterium]|jgi:5-methylcytosine-specific restriction endonuclease McrA
MPFLPKVKEDVIVACGRCCAICHKFCGLKIEVHHIIEESNGGENKFENAIPLCFDCHADMRSYDHKHPKGNKYTDSELLRHRDN